MLNLKFKISKTIVVTFALMQNKSISLLAWLLFISLALIWGSSFILIKKGLVGLSAIQVGSLRIFIAFLCFTPFYAKGLREVSKSKYGYVLLSGMTGNLIPAFLFAIAQTKIQSSVTGVLNSLVPIFILIISVFVFKEKFKRIQIIGLIIGFVGAFILIAFKSTNFQIDLNLYTLLIVGAVICYAISANVIKYKLVELKPMHVSSLALLPVGPIAGFVFIYSGGINAALSSDIGMNSFLYVSFLGLMASTVALVMFNKLLQISPIIFASSVTYVIPIIAITWGLFDGEILGVNQLIGIGIILAGVFLIKK